MPASSNVMFEALCYVLGLPLDNAPKRDYRLVSCGKDQLSSNQNHPTFRREWTVHVSDLLFYTDRFIIILVSERSKFDPNALLRVNMPSSFQPYFPRLFDEASLVIAQSMDRCGGICPNSVNRINLLVTIVISTRQRLLVPT